VRHRLFALSFVAVSALAPVASGAQTPRPLVPASREPRDPRAPLFVSVEWLSQHQHDGTLVVLHVGDKDAYATAHIPGARLASVADVSVGDRNGPGLSVEMPAADSLRARLATLGISDDSRVIVYYAKDQTYQATRILLTLAYAGLDAHASLLDGGMGAWTAAGHAVTAELPALRTGSLAPLAIHPFVVDAGWVASMRGRPGVALVDARDTAFYNGSRTGGSAAAPQRAGHIPGALSIPFSTLFDDALRIRPAADLARAFDAAGVKPGDVVVGYCHTGQQATALMTAARSLGHPVLLYDGSFQDWSGRSDLPVEVGPPGKAR